MRRTQRALKSVTLILTGSALCFGALFVKIVDASDSNVDQRILYAANAPDSEAPGSSGSNASDNLLANYDTHIVRGQALGAETIVGGSVIPAHQVLLTAQVSGKINYLGGFEGDNFERRSILVEIKADELLARREAALAQLQNAQADVRNADVQYERELYSPRSRSLSQSGGMGLPLLFDQMFTRPLTNALPGDIGGDTYLDRRADLYLARTQREQAEGRYRQIQFQINEIDAYIADSRHYTPFPGVILERMADVGDTTHVGSPLMRYADLSMLQIEAQVPASRIFALSRNMLVSVTFSDPALNTDVRVARIFPAANSRRRTVTVKFDLPTGHRAIPGLYAELRLPGRKVGAETAPVIPLSAITFNGSLPTVRVLTADNRVSLRMIRLGERLGNDEVAVFSGLDIGERILTRR